MQPRGRPPHHSSRAARYRTCMNTPSRAKSQERVVISDVNSAELSERPLLRNLILRLREDPYVGGLRRGGVLDSVGSQYNKHSKRDPQDKKVSSAPDRRCDVDVYSKFGMMSGSRHFPSSLPAEKWVFTRTGREDVALPALHAQAYARVLRFQSTGLI